MNKPKLIRVTTVPVSLKTLLKGHHRFMSEHGFEVIGVSSSGKELQDVAKNENIRVEVLEMTRTISPIRDLKSLWEFYTLCKRERPTIVHSHTPKAGIVGMLGAKLAGVPIRLYTVAGLPLMEATGKKRKVLDFVEKLTYRCATKVYPNSKGLYDFIIEHQFTSSEKLKVIGQGSSNGIDTNFFDPIHFSINQKESLRKRLGIKTNDFVFIFVGRLVGDKGINELVASFRQLGTRNSVIGIRDQELDKSEENQQLPSSESQVPNSKSQVPNPQSPVPSPKLLLVGPFETELDPLQPDTLNEIKTNPNIISVGFQEDVRPYFAISNCLVFPSYREGFPNVVMQAGAMGLPSIVTDINGCNEIVVDGVNGIIIPVKNSEALQKAMIRLLQDKDLHQQLKSNARMMITSRYEQKVVWEALLEEYKRLLGTGD